MNCIPIVQGVILFVSEFIFIEKVLLYWSYRFFMRFMLRNLFKAEKRGWISSLGGQLGWTVGPGIESSSYELLGEQ